MSLPPRGQGDGAPGSEMAGAALPPGVPSIGNDEMITSIMQMGISREAAQLAVQQTGGNSVEAAIAWVFENGSGVSDAQMEQEGLYEEYKMVFVVNGALPMGIGKIAAQVGHAAVDLYRLLISSQEKFGGAVLQWNENGSKKVALRSESVDEMNELAQKAEKLGLPNTIIQDAGRTEIPSGSQTVLAIFGTSKQVDEVTGRLKLL